MKNPFSLSSTFGLSDFVSLRDNDLNPVILQVHGKQSISLDLGPTVIYHLDEEVKSVLIVVNVGTDTPLIIFASQLDVLIPRSMLEWQNSNENWIFSNPEAEINSLSPATQFPNPDGRLYIRTLPKVLENENPDNLPKQFTGCAQGANIPSHEQYVGTLTVYEADDENPDAHFVVLINIMNLAVPETGGLLTFYVGRKINPSEID